MKKELPTEDFSNQTLDTRYFETQDEIPEVSLGESSLELVEQRVKVLFPLMMKAARLDGVVKGLLRLEGQEGNINIFRKAPVDIAPEIHDLVRQAGFLRTAGLSDEEITMTPFWRESLSKIRDQLNKKLEEVEMKVQKYADKTDIKIGFTIQNAVYMKIGLDSIRSAVDTEEDFREIVESLTRRDRERAEG